VLNKMKSRLCIRFCRGTRKTNEKLSSARTEAIHRAMVKLTLFDRILVAARAATATRQRVTLVARLGFSIMVIDVIKGKKCQVFELFSNANNV
jgi:hypothetical protein